jgi:hypothetical protein
MLLNTKGMKDNYVTNDNATSGDNCDAPFIVQNKIEQY